MGSRKKNKVDENSEEKFSRCLENDESEKRGKSKLILCLHCILTRIKIMHETTLVAV